MLLLDTDVMVDIQRGLALCSFNDKHYRIIPDLQIVKPYSRDREPRE
jgi:hypothetical protein